MKKTNNKKDMPFTLSDFFEQIGKLKNTEIPVTVIFYL